MERDGLHLSFLFVLLYNSQFLPNLEKKLQKRQTE